MKSIVSIAATALLAGFFVFYSLVDGAENERSKIAISGTDIDLSDERAVFVGALDEDQNRFVWDRVGDARSLLSGEYESRFLYRKLSPVDGVYTIGQESLSVEATSGGTRIRVGEGQYVFAFTDPYRSYEIVTDHLVIRQLGTGAFFLDERQDRHAVYSMSALLDIGLLSDAGEAVTRFTLFPTLLFSYEPRYARSLRDADLLRISTILPIASLDAKRESHLDRITGATA